MELMEPQETAEVLAGAPAALPEVLKYPQKDVKRWSEKDLRFWEWCLIHNQKLPPITPDKLIALWKRYGFHPEVLPALRHEFLKRGYDQMTPAEFRKLMEN
jgi:hypothetical protein